MNFTELLKKFNFKPTIPKPEWIDDDFMFIQIYKNGSCQKVEVTYSYSDDSYSIDIFHESGKSVIGDFETMIDFELWNNLFTKNHVEI